MSIQKCTQRNTAVNAFSYMTEPSHNQSSLLRFVQNRNNTEPSQIVRINIFRDTQRSLRAQITSVVTPLFCPDVPSASFVVAQLFLLIVEQQTYDIGLFF